MQSSVAFSWTFFYIIDISLCSEEMRHKVLLSEYSMLHSIVLVITIFTVVTDY